MIKIGLALCFILIGLGRTNAQLRMTQAEARETMSTMAFTIESKITKAKDYEFIHYWNTYLNQETILRINQAGICDQFVTVMPMEQWDYMVKVFNGEVFPEPPVNKPSGKNTRKADNGTTTTMVPHEDKKNFSLVIATPDASN